MCLTFSTSLGDLQVTTRILGERVQVLETENEELKRRLDLLESSDSVTVPQDRQDSRENKGTRPVETEDDYEAATGSDIESSNPNQQRTVQEAPATARNSLQTDTGPTQLKKDRRLMWYIRKIPTNLTCEDVMQRLKKKCGIPTEK